jgi:hypothetical protein
MTRLPVTVTDGTTGSASATFALDDATASVKDDLATIAVVLNTLLDAVRGLERRMGELENR